MKRGETFIPDKFELTGKTLDWIEKNSPTVNVEETLERFCDNAAAKAWAYRDWQAAFRNYIRNGAKYGGVAYKKGRESDPMWQSILSDARKFGFREPYELESVAAYRTQLNLWRGDPRNRTPRLRSVS